MATPQSVAVAEWSNEQEPSSTIAAAASCPDGGPFEAATLVQPVATAPWHSPCHWVRCFQLETPFS